MYVYAIMFMGPLPVRFLDYAQDEAHSRQLNTVVCYLGIGHIVRVRLVIIVLSGRVVRYLLNATNRTTVHLVTTLLSVCNVHSLIHNTNAMQHIDI